MLLSLLMLAFGALKDSLLPLIPLSKSSVEVAKKGGKNFDFLFPPPLPWKLKRRFLMFALDNGLTLVEILCLLQP